jgi:hypothetical protein
MDDRADAGSLRQGVRDRYRDVALNPDGSLGSYTGRPLAAKLGYPGAVVDALPDRAVESFAGVSSPFRASINGGGGPLSYDAAHHRWQGYCARSGVDLDIHQLRHVLSALCTEDGTSTPMLLARSRHASVRSLERYARPGPEAVARHAAAADPAARRRCP